MKQKIVFVGVNYCTPKKTLNWIKSIQKNLGEYFIIVVDNSAEYNENLVEDIRELADGNVIYINSGKNLGYFNGAEYAYQYLKDNNIVFDWFVVSNVDVELVSADVILILNKYKNVGVVAPQIKSIGTDVDKNPYRLHRLSKKNMIIKKIAFSNSLFCVMYTFVSNLRNKLIYKKLKGKKKCLEGTAIYMPYGACLFFNRIFFDNGGTIKFPLFLFGEELFVAEQCKRLQLDIKYVPSIQVINYEHASTAMIANRFVRKCNYKAMSYVLKEFY